MAGDKQAQRARYLRLRTTIEANQRTAWNDALTQRLTEFLLDLGGRAATFPTVAGYMAHRGEPDVSGVLDTLSDKGWRVAYPKTDRQAHALRFYQAGTAGRKAFQTGPFGILEPIPSEETAVPASEIDIVLLPGLAFRRDGLRIGYGGGYYDRLLADPHVHAVRVGVAFDVLIADDLPAGPHDIRMHEIVTESEVVRCQPAR